MVADEKPETDEVAETDEVPEEVRGYVGRIFRFIVLEATKRLKREWDLVGPQMHRFDVHVCGDTVFLFQVLGGAVDAYRISPNWERRKFPRNDVLTPAQSLAALRMYTDVQPRYTLTVGHSVEMREQWLLCAAMLGHEVGDDAAAIIGRNVMALEVPEIVTAMQKYTKWSPEFEAMWIKMFSG